MKYRVGIIGCGVILNRHIESIKLNDDFKLVALCDINQLLVENAAKKENVKHYTDYKKMIEKEDLNFIVICTPNSIHYDQSIYSLKNGCDVLIEKPVSFKSEKIKEIKKIADECNQRAYCVLQVRLNPTIMLMKNVLDSDILGKIRGVSLTQRWQRPLEYFSGWRGIPSIGGGTLYEVAIHYIDILQFLFGIPKILSSKAYTTKHKENDIEDTVYSLIDYQSFGGTIEVTISAEPRNLESSIAIMGSNGYVKIGGKALNIIESSNFLSHGSQVQYENMLNKVNISKSPNDYGSYEGSCPNHPELYKNLHKFNIMETYNVIKIIEEIYNGAGISY